MRLFRRWSLRSFPVVRSLDVNTEASDEKAYQDFKEWMKKNEPEEYEKLKGLLPWNL